MNIPKAIFTSLRFNPFFHTRKAAMPISAKRAVHTGLNIQEGGLSSGFIMSAYQPSTEGTVKIEPTIPADSDITIARISLRKLFTLTVFASFFKRSIFPQAQASVKNKNQYANEVSTIL